jgi:hypothetical protein
MADKDLITGTNPGTSGEKNAAPTPKAEVKPTPKGVNTPKAIRPAANPTPITTQQQQRPVDPKTLLRQKILNNIVQKRVGETKQSIYKQLGVQNDKELNGLLEKVKGYEDLNSKFYNLNTELSTLKAEKVAVASGVRQDKVDDLLTFLKGKGLDYTPENIQQIAQSHPEWLTQPEAVKPATIGKVGQQTQPSVSDAEKARNLFPSLRKK